MDNQNYYKNRQILGKCAKLCAKQVLEVLSILLRNQIKKKEMYNICNKNKDQGKF